MKKLLYLRENKGLKQKEVANTLHISTSTYSNYENGSRQPNAIMLKELAKFYGVTVDYLLDVDSTKKVELPRDIYTIGEAVSFLELINLSNFIKHKDPERIITFAKILLMLIKNFNQLF